MGANARNTMRFKQHTKPQDLSERVGVCEKELFARFFAGRTAQTGKVVVQRYLLIFTAFGSLISDRQSRVASVAQLNPLLFRPTFSPLRLNVFDPIAWAGGQNTSSVLKPMTETCSRSFSEVSKPVGSKAARQPGDPCGPLLLQIDHCGMVVVIARPRPPHLPAESSSLSITAVRVDAEPRTSVLGHTNRRRRQATL